MKERRIWKRLTQPWRLVVHCDKANSWFCVCVCVHACMGMCACLCCVWVCVCVCVCVYVCAHMHMQAFVCVCVMFICVHCVCVCVCADVHVFCLCVSECVWCPSVCMSVSVCMLLSHYGDYITLVSKTETSCDTDETGTSRDVDNWQYFCTWQVADCVCLMSLDKTEAIPVDTHVWQFAARHYLPKLLSAKNKSLTDKLYQDIGKWLAAGCICVFWLW